MIGSSIVDRVWSPQVASPAWFKHILKEGLAATLANPNCWHEISLAFLNEFL